MKNKVVWSLIILADILFLAYFTILSVNARPHFDDLGFFSMLRDMPIAEYVHNYYLEESGAFIGYFVNGILFSAINLIGEFKLLPLVWILFGMLLCCLSLRVCLGNMNWRKIVPIVALLYSIFIISNFDAAISYWLCGMSYCLKGSIVLLLLSFINRKGSRAIDWVMVAFLAFWEGGGNAALSCVILATLGMNALVILYLNKWNLSIAFRDARGKKVILALCVMLISFAVVVAAPGNYVRLNGVEFEAMPRPESFAQWLVKCAKCVVMFCYFSAFNIHWYAVTGAIAWTMGKSTDMVVNNGRKLIPVIAGFWVLEMILFSMPQAFLFGGFGYQRVWTPMAFVNVLCVASVFFLMGNTSKWNFNFGKYATGVGLVVLTCIIGWHIASDSKKVIEYAHKYDARWAHLATIPKSSEETIVLEALETPYTADLKYDIYRVLGRKKNPRPELYYVPDSAPELHAKALREYFCLKAKIEIVKSLEAE